MEYWVSVVASFAVGLILGVTLMASLSSTRAVEKNRKAGEYARKYYTLKDKLKRIVEDN